MSKFVRLLAASLVVALLAALMVAPAAAQEEDEGEGGIIVTGTFGAGPNTFSPIFCNGTDCRDVERFMFNGLIGVDIDTGQAVAPNPGAVASSFELLEDGRTYRFVIREDMFWSDGTPITIDDLLYSWEVIKNYEESGYLFPFVSEDQIEDVVQVDDVTLDVTLYEPNCQGIWDAASLEPWPSHFFSQFELSELEDLPFNQAPDITSGPFLFGDYRAGEFTILRGWDDYVDAELGFVNPTGMIQRIFSDQTVMAEDFLSPNGQINIETSIDVGRKDDVFAAAETGDYQTFEYSPGDSWDYMGFNTADPNNPQPALDADGNRIDQGIHPIFGDKLVRQAISHGVDVDAVIEGAVFGHATRMSDPWMPGGFWDSGIEPRAYDTAIALELFAEAGWVPQNPDAEAGPDNPLVCQDCLYAREVDAEFNGSPLEFELITNAGNTRREAIALVIQDELAQVGVTVNTDFIEFNTLISDRVFGAQNYDAYILGWRAGVPDLPDMIQLFSAASDNPEVTGSNTTSFYNERFYELEAIALDPAQTNNCDLETRREIYNEMAQIMADETPYMWLYVQNGLYAVRSDVQGFDPRAQFAWWNVDTWSVISE